MKMLPARMPMLVAGPLIGLSIVSAQHTGDRLTFEVASIKPSSPDARGGGIKPPPGGQVYDATNASVKLMISLMYKIPLRQITGGPGWLDTERFDVRAKAANPSNIDDLHVMFQNLLADEFKLQFHKEIKQGPVYALLVDKTGSKMKVNETAQDFEIPIRGTGRGEFVGVRVPMSYFTWFLSQILQNDERPVIDRTSLDKEYDFTLSFAPELPPGVSRDNLPPGLMDRPTIFNALKEQLGLRLEAQKGPVEMYVIDRAEKPEGK